MKKQKLKIRTESGVATGIIDLPTKVVGAIALAHGAGAGMHHAFMVELAAALAVRGFAILRY